MISSLSFTVNASDIPAHQLFAYLDKKVNEIIFQLNGPDEIEFVDWDADKCWLHIGLKDG